MRKTIVVLSLLMGITAVAHAQQPVLSRVMQAYLEFCLAERAALNPLDCGKLEGCIAESDATSFRYHGTTIVLGRNSTLEDLERGDGEPLGGHAFFRAEYIDSVLTDCVMPEGIDEPVMKRGEENCFIVHRTLGAHGKGVYRFEGGEDMELFVVADFGHVRVSVRNDEGSGVVFSEVAESSEELPAAVLKWRMGIGRIVVTVENVSDRGIGFVIASN